MFSIFHTRLVQASIMSPTEWLIDLVIILLRRAYVYLRFCNIARPTRYGNTCEPASLVAPMRKNSKSATFVLTALNNIVLQSRSPTCLFIRKRGDLVLFEKRFELAGNYSARSSFAARQTASVCM